MNTDLRASAPNRGLSASARGVGVFLALVVLTGCGSSGPERIVIFGDVSYAGQPIMDGIIRFQPIEGTRSAVSTAPIEQGKYYAGALGGVMPGTYQVQILGYEASDQPTRNLSAAPAQLLPEKYNKKSELKITIESGSGRVEQNFDLEPTTSA